VATCLLALLTSTAFVVVSLLPYGVVKSWLDTLAADGDASRVTEAQFRQIVLGLRTTALLLGAAGGFLFVRRVAASALLLALLTDSWRELRHLAGSVATATANEERLHLIGLLMISAGAVVLRLAHYQQPIRFDEAYTFTHFVTKPWFLIISDYSQPNNHILHTLLVRAATGVFGDSVSAIRLPALIAGVLIVPAAYVFARLLFNKHAGLLAAGLISSVAPAVLYSTNARGYSIIVLAFLTAFIVARELGRRNGVGLRVILAGVFVLGLYTMPIMLYPMSVILSWLFLEALRGPQASRIGLMRSAFVVGMVTGIVSFLLYVPVFFNTGFDSLVSNPSVSSKELTSLGEALVENFRETWAT
jgi:uncharacterized membrane protein